LFIAAIVACAPCVASSDAPRAAVAPTGSLAGYVDEDGEYKPSFEVLDLNPPVSWLSEWLVV